MSRQLCKHHPEWDYKIEHACPYCFVELRKIARAADAYVEYLGANAGMTDDWPIAILADSQETCDKLCDLLNTLQDALKPYKSNLPAPDHDGSIQVSEED